MELIFLLVVTFLGISNGQQMLIPLTKTAPEYFPYNAYVESDLYCLGALISTRFVVVNAICIETRRKAKVYLGTRKDPFYPSFDEEGQVIRGSELIVHPQFSKRYSDRQLVNNIGLVKLLDPALLTATVQPIRLPTRQDFPLTAGTLLNVTGYMDSFFRSSKLRYMTVRVRPQRDCYQYYGHNLVQDDERCVEGIGEDRLDWPGVFAKGGKLIGLARVLSREIDCVVSSPPCSPRDVFLNIESFLDWIHDNSDVPRSQGPPSRPSPVKVVRPPIQFVQPPPSPIYVNPQPISVPIDPMIVRPSPIAVQPGPQSIPVPVEPIRSSSMYVRPSPIVVQPVEPQSIPVPVEPIRSSSMYVRPSPFVVGSVGPQPISVPVEPIGSSSMIFRPSPFVVGSVGPQPIPVPVEPMGHSATIVRPSPIVIRPVGPSVIGGNMGPIGTASIIKEIDISEKEIPRKGAEK